MRAVLWGPSNVVRVQDASASPVCYRTALVLDALQGLDDETTCTLVAVLEAQYDLNDKCCRLLAEDELQRAQ